MKHRLFIVLTAIAIAGASIAYAAPSQTYQRTTLPETDNTYDLGANGDAWRNGYINNLTVSSCSGCGSGGSGSPGGASSTIQYNANGAFAGVGNLTTDGTSLTFFGTKATGATGGTGNIVLSASPTLSGTAIAPGIKGGTGAGSTLTLTGTTNASPTTGSAGIIFKGGANGTTESGRIDGSTGNWGIGTTSPWANLSIQDTPGALQSNPIFSVSSSTPGVNAFTVFPDGYIQAGPLASKDTTYCTFGKLCLGYFGSDNTLSAVNLEVGNYNPGASAYGAMTIENNLDDSSGTHYLAWSLNSSNYNDNTFGTALNVPNLAELINSDGAFTFGVNTNATTTANSSYFNWLIGGGNTSNEIARLTATGLGIGTTSPSVALTVGGGQSTNGAALVGEYTDATSTSMTVNFANSNNHVIRTGTAATSIAFSNYYAGGVYTVMICNPSAASPGAITLSGVHYGAATYSQTTTANQCDMLGFRASAATSSPILILTGENTAIQ